MAEHQLPKLNTRVRFPSSAPPRPPPLTPPFIHPSIGCSPINLVWVTYVAAIHDFRRIGLNLERQTRSTSNCRVPVRPEFRPRWAIRARHRRRVGSECWWARLSPRRSASRRVPVLFGREEGRNLFKYSRSKRNSEFSWRSRSSSARASTSGARSSSMTERAFTWATHLPKLFADPVFFATTRSDVRSRSPDGRTAPDTPGCTACVCPTYGHPSRGTCRPASQVSPSGVNPRVLCTMSALAMLFPL